MLVERVTQQSMGIEVIALDVVLHQIGLEGKIGFASLRSKSH
jgi:hypothetical protein